MKKSSSGTNLHRSRIAPSLTQCGAAGKMAKGAIPIARNRKERRVAAKAARKGQRNA